MKTKRLLALAIALLLCVSFVSCRTKDEVAYTYKGDNGTISIKTSLYMCFLMEADQDWQNKAVAAAEESTQTSEDYKELTYEKKDYDTWVKAKAKQYCNEYGYYQLEFKRLGLDFSQEMKDSYEDYYYKSYWDQYYKDIYVANGVSYSTYLEYMFSMNEKDMVYNYYIEEKEDDSTTTTAATTTAATKKGETTTAVETTTTKKVDPAIKKLQGSYRPATSKINNTLKTNYVLVDKLEVSLTDSTGTALTAATKKDYLKTLNGYAKQLKKGTDFATVYETYKTAFNVSDDSSSSTNSSGSSASDYESVLGSAKANSTQDNGTEADEYFSDALKMDNGAVQVIKGDDAYVLLMRKDIMNTANTDASTNATYKDTYSQYAIDILVKDKFQKEVVEKGIEKLDITVNNSAIKFYKPAKIDYLTTTTTTAPATSSVS